MPESVRTGPDRRRSRAECRAQAPPTARPKTPSRLRSDAPLLPACHRSSLALPLATTLPFNPVWELSRLLLVLPAKRNAWGYESVSPEAETPIAPKECAGRGEERHRFDRAMPQTLPRLITGLSLCRARRASELNGPRLFTALDRQRFPFITGLDRPVKSSCVISALRSRGSERAPEDPGTQATDPAVRHRPARLRQAGAPRRCAVQEAPARVQEE